MKSPHNTLKVAHRQLKLSQYFYVQIALESYMRMNCDLFYFSLLVLFASFSCCSLYKFKLKFSFTRKGIKLLFVSISDLSTCFVCVFKFWDPLNIWASPCDKY